MTNRASHIAVSSLLLFMAGIASAQPAIPESAVSATPEQQVTTDDWPTAPTDGMQTSFRIRRDAANGTVVGMSLQESRFPSFLLQLEVVPPGYGPALESDKENTPATPIVEQNMRTVHKLSLRYRF